MYFLPRTERSVYLCVKLYPTVVSQTTSLCLPVPEVETSTVSSVLCISTLCMSEGIELLTSINVHYYSHPSKTPPTSPQNFPNELLLCFISTWFSRNGTESKQSLSHTLNPVTRSSSRSHLTVTIRSKRSEFIKYIEKASFSIKSLPTSPNFIIQGKFPEKECYYCCHS